MHTFYPALTCLFTSKAHLSTQDGYRWAEVAPLPLLMLPSQALTKSFSALHHVFIWHMGGSDRPRCLGLRSKTPVSVCSSFDSHVRCSPLQYHTEQSRCPKNPLCSTYFSPLTPWISLALYFYFLQNVIVRILQCKKSFQTSFSYWPICM
jgi:hypothetical protein